MMLITADAGMDSLEADVTWVGRSWVEGGGLKHWGRQFDLEPELGLDKLPEEVGKTYGCCIILFIP